MKAFLAVLVVALLGLGASGCALSHGSVNASPGLRWWMFSEYGAERICPEMQRHGVPLHLDDRGPSIGRFYPNHCSVEVDDQRHVATVQFGGTGYGHTPMTGRVGFGLTTIIEYSFDFRLHEEGTWVWGKLSRVVMPPRFDVFYVENPVAGALNGPFHGAGNFLGQHIVQKELARGFTAVHRERGNSFALGIYQPPSTPFTPYDVSDSAHYTYANEIISVGVGQRDYLGPFDVLDGDQRLRAQLLARGNALEVMVVPRATGDAWRRSYESGAPLGPPPGPVLAGTPIQPGRALTTVWRLPPGSYYVVIDNTAQAGVVGPPTLPFGLAPPTSVSLVIQLTEQ
ncbi:MAG: hypothetical protein KC731_06600 [Myxococcales bacterium]|nr:hypothetical protein [Myxococcales bacterium]